jgi:hypothetical protein
VLGFESEVVCPDIGESGLEACVVLEGGGEGLLDVVWGGLVGGEAGGGGAVGVVMAGDGHGVFFFDGWVVVGALGVDGLVLMVWVLMVWCWWWMGGFILSVPGMVGYILLKRP